MCSSRCVDLSLVTRKSVFGVNSNTTVQLKKLNIGIKIISDVNTILSRHRTIRVVIRLRDAHADLRICISHMEQTSCFIPLCCFQRHQKYGITVYIELGKFSFKVLETI